MLQGLAGIEILLLIPGATVLGAVLLVLGLRGRLLDDHPVCAKCRFDLHGLDLERTTASCPECATRISDRSPRTGNRKRQPPLILFGSLLLFVAAALLGKHAFILSGLLRPYQLTPTTLLLTQFASDVRHGDADEAAFEEVLLRAQGWNTNSAFYARYRDLLIEVPEHIIRRRVELDTVSGTHTRIADRTKEMYAQGHITWDDLKQTMQRARHLRFDGPETVRADDPLAFTASLIFWSPGSHAPANDPPSTVSISRLALNGVEYDASHWQHRQAFVGRIVDHHVYTLPVLSVEGELGRHSMNWLTPDKRAPSPQEIGIAPGTYQMEITFRIEASPLSYLALSISDPNTSTPRVLEVTHTRILTVIPSSQDHIALREHPPLWQQFLNQPELLRGQLILHPEPRVTITQHRFQVASENTMCPYPFAFEYWVRCDGQEHLLGYDYRHYFVTGASLRGFLVEMEMTASMRLRESQLERLDRDPVLIFRTTREAAARFGLDEIWLAPEDIEIPLEIVDP